MENAMTLANLKLTTAKKATQLSAVVQRRTKLVKRLAEQIELAKAAQNGSTYAPTKLRSITDAETGERKHVSVAKRVKSWMFNADNGKLCVNVRYGARVLDLGKGKTAVELASAKELVATLEIISEAVNAGELDAAMEVASTKLRSAFTK
jgi:prolyl-tRNA editing enzyme YbaK/EbsC (Cys-tRNA(Pro) deacylase)